MTVMHKLLNEHAMFYLERYIILTILKKVTKIPENQCIQIALHYLVCICIQDHHKYSKHWKLFL